MIRIEIKRIFKRKSLYVALLIGIVIASLEAFSNNHIRLKSKDFIDFSNGVYNNLMLYNVGKYMRMLQIIFPLMVTIVFADSYLEDVKSGFIKNMLTRYDKKKYLINRFFVNFVISGLIISIPFIVNYLLYASFIPSIEPKIFFSSPALEARNFLPRIYYKFPLLHVFIRIFLLFIYGGTFSSIALASSIYSRNKYVITIIPFIVYMAMDVIAPMVFPMVSGYRYSPMMFLFNPTGYNHMFIAVPLILITACFSIFIIGGMKNELI
ncbi:hypothetical protein [Clostridium sp. KNHs214]|uniref:hypothetical protein n=1 Tax=Clostridium sp. KNHs214 TaxID=1540257 RepID=UPI000558B9BE|nr:hypothetical protein [Clostridium sp. KNHs214]